MSDAAIRIVVADDHAVVREGIRSVLEQDPKLEVVAEAHDGDAAIAAVDRYDPDVLVLDITMPGPSGFDVAAALRGREPRVGVLVLSMHDHPEYVLRAVRAGADGYVLKSAGPAELRSAVHAVAEGKQAFGARVTSQLGAALREEGARQHQRARLHELTPRERQVLACVAAGQTSREIAEDLNISHRTVESHRESLMRKLEIHSVAGLTRFAVEAGLLDDTP